MQVYLIENENQRRCYRRRPGMLQVSRHLKLRQGEFAFDLLSKEFCFG